LFLLFQVSGFWFDMCLNLTLEFEFEFELDTHNLVDS